MSEKDFVIENNRLIKYSGHDKSVIIPNTIAEISDSAFEDNDFITSINIPNSVTYIGNSAFAKCYNLTSVTLPDSIQNIGWNVFTSYYNNKSDDGNEFIEFAKLVELNVPNTLSVKVIRQLLEELQCLVKVNITIDGNVITKSVDEIIENDFSIFKKGNIQKSLSKNVEVWKAIKPLMDIGKTENEIYSFLDVSKNDVENILKVINAIKSLKVLNKTDEEISSFLEISLQDIPKLLEIENILIG